MIDFLWPLLGFMFLCYSWHHVLDTGLFMVSSRHVQRNWGPGVFLSLTEVSKQRFFLVLAARTLPLRALVSCSSYLYDCLFIARITSRMVLGGPPVLVNVLSSELVLDTLSRSRILVGLFGLHLFASPFGPTKYVFYERSSSRNPLFTSLRSRPDYSLIVAFRSSRL
jgi:hypothetical protein